MLWQGEERVDGPVNFSKGPAATASELFNAGDDQARYVDNFNSSIASQEEEEDRRGDAIFKATGIRVENPYRNHKSVLVPDDFEGTPEDFAKKQFLDYDKRLGELAEQFPQHRDAISPDRSVLSVKGIGIAQEADKKSKDIWERSDKGVLDYAANLAGGFRGMLRDPVNVAALVPGVGQAGTGARALLWAGAKSAAINAGTEAAVQPFVQDWRKQAGLEHGLGKATENIAMAGLFGFGMDAGGRALVRGGKRIFSRANQDKALEDAVGVLPNDHPVKRAVEGDSKALVDLVDSVKEYADPADIDAIRGAMNAVEAERVIIDARPDGVLDADHTDAMIKQLQHAIDPDRYPAPARPPEVIRKAREKPLNDEAPAPVKKGESFSYYDKRVERGDFNAGDLQFDAKAFQFKGDGDASGVTSKLRGVEKWNPLAANKVFVFEKADGSQVIADGHQRLGLAKRLLDNGNEDKINLDGYLFKEADGWSPSDVRVIAAKKNLQEGTGTVMDAARIIREAPEVIDDSVPVSTHQMRQARQLARLSDDAFGMVINDVVKPNYAAMVAEFVGDESRHGSVMRELAELAPTNEAQARQMIADISSLPTTTTTQSTLFGELTQTRSLFKERAKIMDSSIKSLKGEKKVFKVLVDEADRLELAGNSVNREGNITIVDEAGQVAELLTKLATRAGPVSDILNRQAARMAEGASLKQARQGFVDEVRELFEQGGIEALTSEPPKPRLVPDDVSVKDEPFDGEAGQGLGGRGLQEMMQDVQAQKKARDFSPDDVFTSREDVGPDDLFSGLDDAVRIDDLARKVELCGL